MTHRIIHALLPTALVAVLAAPAAHAGYNLSVVAPFSAPNIYSNAGVTFGSDGAIYGTTQGNYNLSTPNYGTLYSVSNGAAVPLINFTGTTGSYLGTQPTASLTVGSNGTFYGTTLKGGNSNNGTIFSYNPGSNAFQTLYSFSGSDGSNPYSALTLSADGHTLYGTTQMGGTNGMGTVFSLNTGGGTLSTLTSFSGANGNNLWGGLLLSGNTLYGTTQTGGDLSLNSGNGYGSVFSLSTSGGVPTTLATFNGANGSFPRGTLTLVGNTLYGTTYQGGNIMVNNGKGYGSVFSLGTGGGVVTTLAAFTGSSGTTPGLLPYAGLALSSDGTLYGTTSSGGSGSGGEFFSYKPGGGVNGSGGTYTGLYAFGGASGNEPFGGVSFGPDGKTLYGTTYTGGPAGAAGTVFGLSAAPEPSEWAALAFTGLGIGGLLLRARRRRS